MYEKGCSCVDRKKRLDLGCPGRIQKQRFIIKLGQQEETGLVEVWKEQRVSLEQVSSGFAGFEIQHRCAALAQGFSSTALKTPVVCCSKATILCWTQRGFYCQGWQGRTTETFFTSLPTAQALKKITRTFLPLQCLRPCTLVPLGCRLIFNDQWLWNCSKKLIVNFGVLCSGFRSV